MISSARRAWRGMALAALVAACVDGPTAPGRFGELRIRPSYDAGDDPAALGVAVDSAAVRVTRGAEPDAPLIDDRVRYPSDTASLGWVVDLRAATESLRVAVTLWSGGTRLYEGVDTVEVRDAALGVAAAPVPVAYVGPPIVATVTVSSPTDTLDALGATATLAAQARDRDGAVIPSAAFTWSSANGAVVTVDPASGVVTATGNGSAVVTAATGAHSGATTVVVAQRVAALDVTPGAVMLTALGATQTLAAAPRDANDHPVAGVGVSWDSDAPGVASVDAATGLVTAVAGGSATITATSGAVTAAAVVTVNPIADVASITVTPSAATLQAVGATRAFTAVARDAAGAVLDGVQFTWSSSVPAVATVDLAGRATAAGHGTTVITAGAGAVTGTAALSVDLAVSIASVTVSPSAATLTAIGATQPFTAVARDAGGAVVPVAAFAWASTAPAVATIDAASGVATAASHGATTIRATVAGVSGAASLSIDLTPSVASVSVTPATATLTSLGATQPLTAVARDAAGAVLPGVPFAWSSSAPGVAAVDPATGLATATGHGAATITAAAGGREGSAMLTVDLTAVVASVTVTPPGAELTAVGATQPFTAVARDAAGSILPGIALAWTSSRSAVATVDGAGVATAQSHGHTTVAATANGVSGHASLRVDLGATITSVVVTPATATLGAVGATQPFAAEARDAGGAVVPVTEFTWSSGAPAVASVDVTGLATAVSHGATTIRATVGGVFGEASLSVDLAPAVASVSVSPGTATLTALGAAQPFTAVARDAAGGALPGVPFAWSSGTPGVATVDALSGVATATGQGATTITATAGGRQGAATLTVDLTSQVASIVVTPASATLTAVGATWPFTAVARDAGGAVLPGIVFAWTSSAPAVALVGGTGVATAQAHGQTTITATANGVSGQAALTVDLGSVIASVVVTPEAATLTAVGATQAYAAVARDAGGSVVPVASFAWSSSVPGVATVDPFSGLATAVGHGASVITATAGGTSGSATLSVDLPVVVATVTVAPSYVWLKSLGATQAFSAVARDAQGDVLPGVVVTWSSSDPAVAAVDAATGVATAVANGTVTIRATAGGVSGTATLKVQQKVVTIVVTPATATLSGRNASQQFAAQAFDANGHVVPGVTFTWSSSNTSIAKVDATGKATTCGYGTVKIKATAGYVTGYATLTVERDPTK